MSKQNKSIITDKVEISVAALIDIKRAFGALIDDKNSFVYQVFMDDSIHHSLLELKIVYAKYFEEEVKNWSNLST